MVKSIELFCGAGGLALGLHQAGFRPCALLEWDESPCQNINTNISAGNRVVRNWHVLQTDVRDVRYEQFGPDIQFITGGPPCQPFSFAGKHRANEDGRDMFPEAVRAVREVKPQGFVFENVRGLLRKSFATYFNYIILQLSYPEIVKKDGMDWTDHLRLLEQHHTSKGHGGLEYNVVCRLLNAADYGVPQIRQRVVIVGFRKDLDISWSFPKPTHSREELLYQQYVSGRYWEMHGIGAKNTLPQQEIDKLKRYFDTHRHTKRWLTVRDAIGDLPDPRSEAARSILNHEYKGASRSYTGHSGSVPDEPSKTIKAGAHGVPGGENMVVLDDGTMRYYTVRESARLQTFPDDYGFYGSWSESMRQIGNAVPVKLAKVIGQSIMKQYKGVAQ